MEMISKNTRIAILTGTYSALGGGVSSAHANLYHSFKDAGYNVKLFVLNKSKNNNQSNDIIYKSGFRKISEFISKIITLFFYLFDNPITYSHTADILKYAIPAFRMNKSIRKFKPDYAIFPDHGAAGLFIKKIPDCKYIWISHHNPSRFANISPDVLFSKRDISTAMKLENLALKKFDIAICPSNYMKEVFLNSYTVIPKDIVVIPNLINQDLIHNIKKCDFPDKLKTNDNAIFIYIPSAGSIFKGSKYLREIILALSKKTDRELIFYLSGSISDDIKSQIVNLPDNVKCFAPGHVTQEENISYIKNCSILISPTLIENFSMAILEALFCGLPALSFDVGGVSDAVHHGFNGYLAPVGDVKELTKYASKLFDDNLRNEFKENALKSARENFNGKVVLRKYEEIFNEN